MERDAAFGIVLADAVDHLTAADPVLAGLIDRVGACTLQPAWSRSPFESLVRSVAYQQLQGRAAAVILKRFLALFEAPFPSPDDIARLDEETMRAVGFSRSKVAAIRDIAADAESGLLPDRASAETMDDAELIRRLTSIRGVGPWTVQMLLIFTLGRLDVLPADDFGVRNGIRRTYGLDALPAKNEVIRMAEAWRPYRSVASWYLWRAAEGRPPQGQDAPLP
jgi:DNA-3-methyladenine glycosylase II